MRKSLVVGFCLLVALVLAGIGAGRLWPERTAHALLNVAHWSTGFVRHRIVTPVGPITYLEAGKGPTVVALHGIFARKEHWWQMALAVKGGYRVVLLDLPGFGDNPVLGRGAYDYEVQARHLRETLDAMGIYRAHLVANSMGAQMAAMLATAQPERIASLAFVGSPVGVTSPTLSDMERALFQGQTPLLVTDRASYDARMDWLFPDPPYVPGSIYEVWAREELARAADNVRIWQEVQASDTPMLEDLAPRLMQPSLILWCTEDRIFHHSGAEVLAQALPKAQLTTLEDCGHLPMLDRPRATGRALRAFLDQVEGRS